MEESLQRTAWLLGESGMAKLSLSRVTVVGVGGVGSFAAEALCRAGVGHLTLVDPDDVAVSNLNRQIQATVRTIGQNKAQALRERLLSIRPEADIQAQSLFVDSQNAGQILCGADYVIDAIDTVTSKVALILVARQLGVPIISSMGAGNKLDPTAFQVGDIYETSVCPLAKVMRKLLKAQGVDSLCVVYSTEPPIKPVHDAENKRLPGSVSFVPSVCGLILAGEVIKSLAL